MRLCWLAYVVTLQHNIHSLSRNQLHKHRQTNIPCAPCDQTQGVVTFTFTRSSLLFFSLAFHLQYNLPCAAPNSSNTLCRSRMFRPIHSTPINATDSRDHSMLSMQRNLHIWTVGVATTQDHKKPNLIFSKHYKQNDCTTPITIIIKFSPYYSAL